jgi:hypothetical protein
MRLKHAADFIRALGSRPPRCSYFEASAGSRTLKAVPLSRLELTDK